MPSCRALRPAAPTTAWALLGMAYPFFGAANGAAATPTEVAADTIVALFFDGAAARG